jgi:glycosyltransferase involved in cell wall biosynthesis
MAFEPLVSVVVSFFNAEKYIEEAIESVYDQTFTDYELILVDDGSTDASSKIAQCHAQFNADRVRYLSHRGHQNRGLAASRNLGVQRARGQYVALLDSDDVWLPHKLAEQISLIEASSEAAMLYGRPQYWRSWAPDQQGTELDWLPDLGVAADRLYWPPELLWSRLAGRAGSPCPSDLLLKRDAIVQVGGFEEKFAGIRSVYEDQAFVTKMSLHKPIYVSSRCWDRYRLHPESIVAKVIATGQFPAARSFYLEWLWNYLSQQGFDDPGILRRIRRSRWACRHPLLARMTRPARQWWNRNLAKERQVGPVMPFISFDG